MRAAIIGCGQIADAHVQEINRIPDASVVAVCDLDHHMAEQAAARFHISGVYTDVDRLLSEAKPDVVHITTPPATHLALGRRVLNCGAHVYMEKPFTVTTAEAEELVDLATRQGRLVCVGHCNAFDSAFLRLRQAYDEGQLGAVVHVDTSMGYNLSGPFGAVMMGDPLHWVHQMPGGVVQNNLSHPLSLLMPFLTDEHPELLVRGLRWREKRYSDVRDQFPDELRVILCGAKSTASLVFTCQARPVQLYVTVRGTKAQATASLDGRTLQFQRGASMPGPFARLHWAYQQSREAGRELKRNATNLALAKLHFFEGMHELIRRFYLAIEGRGEMPIAMSEAIRTTRIMEEIFQRCRFEEGSP